MPDPKRERKSLLWIDDQPELLERHIVELEWLAETNPKYANLEVTVSYASTIEEAKRKLLRTDFEIVVTDMMMVSASDIETRAGFLILELIESGKSGQSTKPDVFIYTAYPGGVFTDADEPKLGDCRVFAKPTTEAIEIAICDTLLKRRNR